MKYTLFMDMSSGGSQKTDYDSIYIQANLKDSLKVFDLVFAIDPDNVTCDCCGPDFWVDEEHANESDIEKEKAYNVYNYNKRKIKVITEDEVKELLKS